MLTQHNTPIGPVWLPPLSVESHLVDVSQLILFFVSGGNKKNVKNKIMIWSDVFESSCAENAHYSPPGLVPPYMVTFRPLTWHGVVITFLLSSLFLRRSSRRFYLKRKKNLKSRRVLYSVIRRNNSFICCPN